MGFIGDFFGLIPTYLGKLLYLIYSTIAFNNYGIALILFTIIVKLVMLPLNIKQYRSTSKMQELQPKLQEIQKRYKNDKEKLNQETMKLYTDHGYNPAGGCLPMLLQMPILFSLFYVIRRPMHYVLGYSNEKLGEIFVNLHQKAPEVMDPVKLNRALESAKNGKDNAFDVSSMVQMAGDKIASIDLSGVHDKFDILFDAVVKNDGYVEVGMLNQLNINPSLVPNIETIKMTFLRIFNLGIPPKWNPTEIMQEPATYVPLFILVLLTAAITYFSSKISMNSTQKNTAGGQSKAMDQTAAMTKNMMLLGPIMTLWIGFSAPAGLALYWMISSGTQMIQQWYINKFVIRKK